MDKIRIRKDIPIPKKSSQHRSSLLDAFQRMETGDSIDMPGTSSYNNFYQAAQRAGIRITVQRIVEGGDKVFYRVWRVEQ